jgi:hypothetical protein
MLKQMGVHDRCGEPVTKPVEARDMLFSSSVKRPWSRHGFLLACFLSIVISQAYGDVASSSSALISGRMADKNFSHLATFSATSVRMKLHERHIVGGLTVGEERVVQLAILLFQPTGFDHGLIERSTHTGVLAEFATLFQKESSYRIEQCIIGTVDRERQRSCGEFTLGGRETVIRFGPPAPNGFSFRVTRRHREIPSRSMNA